jgi:glycosyltransferase involved in cell wall biosynthesis
MKIVYVSENFPPYVFGGGELSAHALAKELAKDPKYEVHVITKKIEGEIQEENMDGIIVHRVIPEGSKKLPDDIRRGELLTHNTAKAMKPLLNDAALVHTVSMRIAIGAYKAARKQELPIIATVNDTWATCYYSLHMKEHDICWTCSKKELKDCLGKYGGNKLAMPYLVQNMKRRADRLKKFDCLLPRSNLIKQILQKNGFTNRMEPFPPIIDPSKYRFKEPTDSQQVLFVGRLDRGKGVEDAISAFNHSTKGNLLIVGDGPYRKEFEKLVTKQKLTSRVTFTGKLTVDEMIKNLYRSAVVLVPFNRVEPMPRIIQEAFACGRGIITTDLCGGNEYVENGKNGYVVESGNIKRLGELIDTVLNDKELINKLGIAGRKMFEKYLHPDIIMKKYKKILNDIAK